MSLGGEPSRLWSGAIAVTSGVYTQRCTSFDVFISSKQDVPTYLQYGGTQLPPFCHICAKGINMCTHIHADAHRYEITSLYTYTLAKSRLDTLSYLQEVDLQIYPSQYFLFCKFFLFIRKDKYIVLEETSLFEIFLLHTEC